MEEEWIHITHSLKYIFMTPIAMHTKTTPNKLVKYLFLNQKNKMENLY